MANNVYIGMRYVPIFDGAYNSEKVYEPLTIVEYLNSSYTSKRAVPAGILPTNTEYWARSGDFNAQYNELDGRITDNADAIEDLGDVVEDNYQGYLDGKTIAILGDSTGKLFDTFNHFAEYTNATIVNVSVNGAQWDNVLTQLSNLTVTPDFMIVVCGSNDINAAPSYWLGHKLGAPDLNDHTVKNDGTTFDNIKKFCTNARDAYPRCEIIGLLRADHPHIDRAKWEYYKYFETMILSEFGVPCIDIQAIANLAYFNSSEAAWAIQNDGLHYTDPMMDRLTRHMVDILKNAWMYNISANKPNCYYADYELSSYSPTGWAEACMWVAKHCYHKGNTSSGWFDEICTVFCRNEGGAEADAFVRASMLTTDYNARITIYANDRVWYAICNLNTSTVTSINEGVYRWQTPSTQNISNLPTGMYPFGGAVYSEYTNMPPASGGYTIWVARLYTTSGAEGFGTYLAMKLGDARAYVGYDSGVGTTITWRQITATTPT